jgi:SAM-dependent methyltransferase
VALATARRGSYPAGRVEADVPAPLIARYFRRIGDQLALNDRLRAHVRFLPHNLLAPQQPRELDLVLCRNVLIYFDDARKAEVVQKLVRALRPGGWLLCGYSETLRDTPELTAEAPAVYRRHDGGRERQKPPTTVRALLSGTAGPGALRPSPAQIPAGVPAPVHAPTPPQQPGHAPPLKVLALRGDYVDARRLTAELRPLVGQAPALVDLDGASFLGDEAARVLRRAAEAAPHLTLRATRPAVRRWLQRHGIRPR